MCLPAPNYSNGNAGAAEQHHDHGNDIAADIPAPPAVDLQKLHEINDDTHTLLKIWCVTSDAGILVQSHWELCHRIIFTFMSLTVIIHRRHSRDMALYDVSCFPPVGEWKWWMGRRA